MCPDCGNKFSAKKIIFSVLIILITVFIANKYMGTSNKISKSSIKDEVIVYKNKSCDCCSKWAKHMEVNGFKVVEKSVDNLEEIKKSLGVPENMRSCHTAVLGEYVFEGHIPAQSVKRFLKNTNNLKGLVVPGMPTGSPGMEHGAHKEKFTVLSFDKNGIISTFEEFN